MSVGVIRVELELYLDCDIEDDEAREVVNLLPEHLMDNPIEGVDVSHINVTDKTSY